jgi:transcriptional regulator with XRE-family HTH domain
MLKRISERKDPYFSVFLRQVREESDVLAEDLVEGLMDISQLSRIESAERPVCKTMRNRLLERLGVAPETYENLLRNEDYEEWECQHRILCAVERKDFPEAVRLIEEYEALESADGKVKQQFCLVMRAELLRLQGAERVEIADYYDAAVRLTVPGVERVYAKTGLLSVLEINIVLEYEYYRESAFGFVYKCRFWMDYVKDSLYDELTRAKIYPKIAHYYFRAMMGGDTAMSLADLEQALRLCDEAMELLRNTGRAFYLVELLEYRGKILTDLIKRLVESGEMQESVQYEMTLQENMELEGVLKELYAAYDVPAYMQDCTYLYRQRWVFAIGDVLRIRRNMLGMTQKQLCEGICSVKSLQRAENRQHNMQREPLEKILRRLGLSGEIQKTALVADNREVLQLMAEMALCCNNRETGKTRVLLERLKAEVCLEIPENRQYVMEMEAALDWMEGKITAQQFVSRQEEALHCTLNTDRWYEMDDVYLTETEMTCIRQRLKGLDDIEKRRQIEFLIHFFEEYEKRNLLSEYIAMYEYVMVLVTSELGNMGTYHLATELDGKVLRTALKCRRVYSVSDFLYDIWWNEVEQKAYAEQQPEKEKMTDSLTWCIAISHFSKRAFYENFYLDKMRQVRELL